MRHRVQQGDKDAAELHDEILIALAVIADDPCVGYRMRGLPVLETLCAYHLPAPFRRWRVIYRHAAGHGEPQLILLGEHWKRVSGSAGRGGPSDVASRLRFADVYDAVASFHGGNSKGERARIQRAVRNLEKERCC